MTEMPERPMNDHRWLALVNSIRLGEWDTFRAMLDEFTETDAKHVLIATQLALAGIIDAYAVSFGIDPSEMMQMASVEFQQDYPEGEGDDGQPDA